jgi:hypothetical protein
VIEVKLTTVIPVQAVPPKVGIAPVKKPVPVIVTDVPPTAKPLVGDIEVKVGAA